MTTVNTHTKDLIENRLVAGLEEVMDSLPGRHNSRLNEVRKEALECFLSLGVPTRKHEDWKYTDVRTLLNRDYLFHLHDGESLPQSLPAMDFPDLHTYRGVTDNSSNPEFNSELLAKTQAGFLFCSMGEAMDRHSEILEKHYFRHFAAKDNPFAALNTAFARNGFLVCIPSGKEVDHPVQLLYLTRPASGNDGVIPLFIQPRTLIVAEKNSRVEIIEHFMNIDGTEKGAVFSNSVTEIICGENTRVDHCIIQETGPYSPLIQTVNVHLRKDSTYKVSTVTINSGFTRNNLCILLDGENSSAMLNGLYLLRGNEHADNHTLIEHRKPHCISDEFYAGVLDGHSSGAFRGKIHVHPQAQKTNAYQANRNILLSPHAAINAKPQLEIYADDVRCTHGATTGQLDEDALFYLRSRGLNETQARGMLLYAFAGAVLQRIGREPLRKYLEQKVRQWLIQPNDSNLHRAV